MIGLQILSILVALLLGIVVLSRDYSDRNRWLILFFNAIVALWIASGILADIPGDLGLFWNRVVFISGLLAGLAGYLLIASLANRLNRIAFLVIISLAAWCSIILLTPFVVSGVALRPASDGLSAGLNAIHGPGYLLYVLSLLGTGGSVVAFVFRRMFKSRGRFRNQLAIIAAGFVAMLLSGLLFGVILPVILHSSAPANLAFLSALMAVAAFTYAIARQRLFDIRLAIARTLAYFLALGVIALVYALGIFTLSDLIFGTQNSNTGLRAYYVIASLLVALTFGTIRRFFVRLTRRIFFRDSYDTEEVFSRLTSSLVGTVDLTVLTRTASHILQDAIKVDNLQIVPRKYNEERSELFKAVKALSEPVVVTDELAIKHKRLADQLSEANIAMISRLQTHQEVVGYLVCGPKIRGDALTGQDVELIRVASGELAVAVQNAQRFEEISHFNTKLKQEVDEATEQLRDSNRKLKKLDEAKDEFISMASHQLRTPLTSVKGYISMVIDGDAGNLNEQQQKLLEEAFTSAQRMVYLIGDFLNVSRIQTGKFVLETKPTNLVQVVSDEIEQLHSTAERRNIRVEYTPPSQFPILTLDENKIRQVIMNFVDNAIFYSKPDSSVQVILLNTGKEVRLEVHDTGIGVPEAERHKLFTKFFRAENARRVRPDGTGIGLFMAKKVITAHGGSIIAETRENKGSTFGFSLPLKDQAN